MASFNFNIGPGVAQAMNNADDVPRSDELYDNKPGQPVVSHTYGRDAVYVYYGEDNLVKRLPFE